MNWKFRFSARVNVLDPPGIRKEWIESQAFGARFYMDC